MISDTNDPANLVLDFAEIHFDNRNSILTYIFEDDLYC